MVCKKEVLSLFHSTMRYLCTALLLLITGMFFTAFGLQGDVAEFGCVLDDTTVVLLIMISVITMRALEEEQRQKTSQLLFVAPVEVNRIALGKSFAILIVFVVPLTVLTTCPLVLSLYDVVSLKELYSCLLAFLFIGAVCIAIGIFISSITKSQIITAAGTFVIIPCSYLANDVNDLMDTSAANPVAGFVVVVLPGGILLAVMTESLPLGAAAAGTCEMGLGAVYLMDSTVFKGTSPCFLGFFFLFQCYYDFVDEIFDVTHLVHYLGVVMLFLFFAARSVERHRRDSFGSKYFKIGLYAAIAYVLMVVIVILSNLITHKFPSRYIRHGTSASRLYNISPQAREVVPANGAPVSLYLITSKRKEDRRLT